ncbi:MAG: DNA repair protein RecN [Bacteroidales bacterium]|nr:DNA repair protein RecN [Bacteroidales bacterium]
MLQTLHIENYALIRETDIRFGTGFTAITGETGAGKSILLGALGLLLGQRADTAVLADKGRKCIVEAQFDVAGLGLEGIFTEADVDYDDRLILRREILPSAKSRAFANDTPVQLAFLKTLGSRLVDIHSQHQTLTLADSHFRLSLLDTLGAQKASQAYGEAYGTYSTLKRQLEELTTTEAQNRKEQDYLQFQYDELAAAHLVADEQETLEQEQQLLAHAEAIREGLATASAALDDDSEGAVLPRLRQAKAALTHIAAYHPAAEELLSRLDTTLIELDDVNGELQHAATAISYSPERQQQVDDRLAMLYRLEKKHGVDTVEALITLRDSLDERLQGIASLDERIKEQMEAVDAAFAALQSAAAVLTKTRDKACKLLSKNILPILHELGMPEARFSVELTPTATYGATGHDAVRFLFDANRGGTLRDVADVASGGELSRLMLAIKSMLTSRTLLPTVIFDEIDSGVSGDISVAVGRIMSRMAETMQVVAITHLPQIAARAAQHVKVYKENDADRTVSRLRELDADSRVVEVATMLSSDPPTAAALQTAKELMSL